MLNISSFEIMTDTEDSSVMCYFGENHYVIYQDNGYYTLSVRRLDETEETFGCSSLHVAIASIEALERGEEI